MVNKQRKLTAIMFTDIVGYTAIMAEDESQAIDILHKNRDLVTKSVVDHGGDFIKEIGDGTLSCFDSTLNAVNCAIDIQTKLKGNNLFNLRIGIHVGDVIQENHDIFGDGVNIASRLEHQAFAGGICISETVFEAIRSHPDISVTNLGPVTLKGTGRAINIYNLDIKNFISHNLIDRNHELNYKSQSNFNPKLSFRNTITTYYKIIWLSIAVLIFFIWSFIYRSSNNEIKPEQQVEKNIMDNQASIAVLPFEDFSEDKDLDYLSSGLTEEILNVLANIKELRVVARTSSAVFKGVTQDLREIGKKLNVNYILEGSIRRNKNQIRVTAQLINTHNNLHLMSQNFDYELNDLFQFHDEISKQIVDKMSLILSPDSKSILEKKQILNSDAYNYYLIGISYFSRDITEKTLIEAIEAYQQAIQIDANFAKAYAGLCRTYILANEYYATNSNELIEKADIACKKAKKLDPSLIDIYISLGGLYREKIEYSSAISVLEIALNKNPNSVDTLVELGHVYREMQNLELAEEYLNKALDLDPTNYKVYNQLGLAYLFLGSPEKAEAALTKVIEIDPNNTSGLNNLGVHYLFRAKFEKAESSFQRAMQIDPRSVSNINYATTLYYLGRYLEAIKLYKQSLEFDKNNHLIWGNIADSYFQLGELTQAKENYLAAIEQAELLLLKTPKDIPTINILAYYYAKNGLFDKAKTYRELSINSTTEDMYIFYYAALTNLIIGDIQGALNDLKMAINKGYNTEFLSMDPELASLHNTPKFISLLNEKH